MINAGTETEAESVQRVLQFLYDNKVLPEKVSAVFYAILQLFLLNLGDVSALRTTCAASVRA